MEERTKLIKVEALGAGVSLLTLNNPPLNINSIEMTRQLAEALGALDADPATRVVVVTGAGTRAFCAGSDVKEFPAISDDFVGKKLRRENEVFDMVEELSQPVIAAIEGVALGGGCELAMACDIRIMAASARIGLPEVNLGVFGGSGGLFRTPALVGASRAKELMFLGELIPADEAERIGLVSHVVPDGEAVPRAVAMAERIAAKPFEAIKAIKLGVRQCTGVSRADALKINFQLTDHVFRSDDCREAVSAFLEKRAQRSSDRSKSESSND
ncbi:enoyl-CoA hydratase/isomerase family protein [Uliginosibacterium sp. sgz301328]|uniref:enoyl-CoA hydratase/isomerase family protein n=1 Tax=Uliginosibacterium sp. sgz301328 TaxID=3243764 RepID=UPI00359CE3EF